MIMGCTYCQLTILIGARSFNQEFIKAYEDKLFYDEEVIRNLKKMIPLIKSMKTSFDHVRGDVEAREIMVDTINRAIEIIGNK